MEITSWAWFLGDAVAGLTGFMLGKALGPGATILEGDLELRQHLGLIMECVAVHRCEYYFVDFG